MSDFYSINMAVLKKHYPPLAEELNRVSINEDDFKTERAVSGEPTLVYKGIYLHSKRDPVREAERLAEADLQGQDAPAVVLGFGLGFSAEAIGSKFPGRPIIILEKRKDVLKKALELRDFRAFLTGNRIAFVFDPQSVISALSMFDSSKNETFNDAKEKSPPLIITNRALTGLDKAFYEDAEQRLKSKYTQSNVNIATKKRFEDRWHRNLARNIEAIRDIPGIVKFGGILNEKIPVFLAAAGPSLDSIGPYLAEIKKRCLLIAVDTSLNFIRSNGIEADFVVSVDPQYLNFRHFDRVKLGETRLISETVVYPTILRLPFAKKYLCGSSFPPGHMIEGKVDPKGDLAAGGSVATSAWDLGRHLGAHEIWIVGLDLSFPDYKTHFRGAYFEEKSHLEARRFFPAENWSFRNILSGHPYWGRRIGGGQVLTDRRLSIYAAWFENRFAMHPKIRNYGLFASGLEIRGLEAREIADFLALRECRGEIDELLSETDRKIRAEFDSEKEVERRRIKFEEARSINP
ncbi:MAG: DUF115 domain-containing protein [Treponema sp.]|nr:DUF115 domain-containing protein [Treponema sp.]